jgi:hypothetical protein
LVLELATINPFCLDLLGEAPGLGQGFLLRRMFREDERAHRHTPPSSEWLPSGDFDNPLAPIAQGVDNPRSQPDQQGNTR